MNLFSQFSLSLKVYIQDQITELETSHVRLLLRCVPVCAHRVAKVEKADRQFSDLVPAVFP